MNKPQRQKSGKPQHQDKQTSRDFNPAWTFNTFVVGTSNLCAFNAAQLVAGTLKTQYNPLYIYGDVGLGKTHLLNAIGLYRKATLTSRVCTVTAESFTNNYINALQQRELIQFRHNYRNQELLLIDSIQFFAGKERMQEEFLHTFNALHDSGKQVVITADRAPNHIPGLAASLVDRFEAGLCVEIGPPDIDTISSILRRKLEARRTSLTEECFAHITNVAGLNIRRLEGAIIRATSYKAISGKDLTLPILKSLLKYLTKQRSAHQA
jgi:chromosomal replication initiator protein